MNTKKLVIFGSSAVVLAGVLVYALGIYPPASGRDGRGAIGQRNVYRAEQPADASVNPNDAPVATADQLQNGKVISLQNGQFFKLSDGQMFLVQSGSIVALQSGITYQLNSGEKIKFDNGIVYQLIGNQLQQTNLAVNQMTVQNGQMISLGNGMVYQLNGNQLQQMNLNGNNLQNQLIEK